MAASPRIVRLAELESGQAGNCFVLLEEKNRSTARDGQPYFRVRFRDRQRTVTAMIWSNSAWFAACESEWTIGEFYKLRCRYVESPYGPQIEIDNIRAVAESDRADGFNPTDFLATSRFDVAKMFDELVAIAGEQIAEAPLRKLTLGLLHEHAASIRQIAAAARNHHAFAGGYLEHVLSVTRTAGYLADKYAAYYVDLEPPLSKSLTVAGAILHDIGKVVELQFHPHGTTYTAEGRLIGHILLGRDLVRDKARSIEALDPETLLRLEHIIVSHQNLPEWGSPIAPHTPEALLVHYADDLDTKFHQVAMSLIDSATSDGEFTSRANPLKRSFFRGLDRPPSGA